MGAETGVVLPGFGEGTHFAKFRAKAQAFFRAHQDHIAIHKLRMNKALTVADLAELERMLAESGVAAPKTSNRPRRRRRGSVFLSDRWLEWTDRPPRRHWRVF